MQKHHTNMKKIYSLILVLFLITSSLIGQCNLKPITLVQRVNNANLIIEGDVISKVSFWNPAHNFIQTSNLVRVKQVLKGTYTQNFLEVITDGGEKDQVRIVVEPALELAEGDEGVFMLNIKNVTAQQGFPTFEIYADMQGFIKFNVKENSATDPFNTYNDINTDLYTPLSTLIGTNLPQYLGAQAGRFNSPSSIMAAVTTISPLNITAGTFSILTINGSGFGAGPSATSFVEFKNADDGGLTFIQPSQATQYVSWTATQIQVRVPTKTSGSGTAGTGQVRVTVASSASLSAQTLTVNWGELNILSTSSPTTMYNTRHVNISGGGYVWQMYTTFDATAAAKAAFLRAQKTWTCTTYINWTNGAVVSTNTAALDGVNVVRFDVGAELPAGVLGRCTSYWSGCGGNPSANWYVSELDIVFDDATNWQYGPALATGSQYDFESVAVHELGHGHQLSHVINSNDVMHYSIANGQNKRTLNSDDINGGNNVMTRNLSGGVCAKPVMTAMSAASCTTLAPTASFVITPTLACTGQLITMTDQSLNGPSTWTWTMTGGTPNSSNAQNPTTTYNSAGIYTVTLVCSNSNGTSAPYSKTVSIVASPTVAVTSASICPTKVATLTASGATSFTWTPGNLIGATQTLSPASTQVYNVVGSNGTCTNSATGTVTVLPGANPSVSNSTICAGSPVLKTATGANSYTWNPGALTGSAQTLSPANTTTYTVIGAVGTCTAQTTFVIVTSTVLTGVSVSPTSTTVCAGSPVSFTASGGTTYTWQPGSATGSVQTYSPMASTIYTVTAKTGSCSGTATAALNTTTVLAGVSISPNSVTLCAGQTTVLTASGASTYTWNTSASTSTILVAASSTVYSVNGQTGNCFGSSNATITLGVCSGISGNGKEIVASIYPNPTQGMVVMKFESAFRGSITVYNAIGQLIVERKLADLNEYQLDISSQANGVYMMKLKADNGTEKVIKVIKQ
jgi:hypothetical protein